MTVPSFSFIPSTAHTHTQSTSGYLCVFALVYFSVLPACGLTYSRVQKVSKEAYEQNFLFSSDCSSSAWAFCCSSSLLTDTQLLQGLSRVLLLLQSTYSSQTQSLQIKHGNSVLPFALSFSLLSLFLGLPPPFPTTLWLLAFFHSHAMLEGKYSMP